jgi:hypothetical protein
MKKAPAATAGARGFIARNRSHGDRIGLRKHITLSGVGSSERTERLPARRRRFTLPCRLFGQSCSPHFLAERLRSTSAEPISKAVNRLLFSGSRPSINCGRLFEALDQRERRIRLSSGLSDRWRAQAAAAGMDRCWRQARGGSMWISTSCPPMGCERQGGRTRNPSMICYRDHGSRSPSDGGWLQVPARRLQRRVGALS